MDRTRWVQFLGWGLVGACFALGVSQVGLFTIPLGIVLGLLLSRGHAVHASLGLLAGAGVISAVIGVINLDYQQCPTSGHLTLAPNQTSVSCGGFDGTPWLIVGAVMILIAIAAYWRLNRS